MEFSAAVNIQFEKHYLDYLPVMSKTAYMKIGNFEDAEDLCQDLFINYYNNIGRIKKDKSWLNCVLNNLVSDYHRVSVKSLDFSHGWEMFDSGAYPFLDSAIEARIILKDIFKNDRVFNDCLDRDVFQLYFFEDMPCGEISARVNLTRRQVYYRIEKVKTRIRYFLRQRGIGCINDIL